MRFQSSWMLVFLCVCAAHAEEAPAFDRPGIAFSASVLPAGSLAWEQGLPDYSRDSSGDLTTSIYSANTLLRLGLSETLEMQLGGSPYNAQRTRGAGESQTDTGAGDSSVALKWALPLPSSSWSMAMLGGMGLDTGSAAFRADAKDYFIAATVAKELSDNQSAAIMLSADFSDGSSSYTLSPNWSLALTDEISAYVEAGWTFTDGEREESVAGAGLTWLINNRIQFDVYGLWALDERSTDVQAGFGVSVFFGS